MDYEYRAQVIILQGGYPSEWKDVIPQDNSWHPGEQQVGPLTFEYYYTDSNSGDNNNSSRVTYKITDSWTAEFDDTTNELKVTVTTSIESVIRGEIHGNPLSGGNWTRDIIVGREPGDKKWEVNGDNIGHAHTLQGKIDLGTATIVIPPGGEVERGTVYVLNHTTGLSWSVPDYTDEMWMGISFRNNRKPIEPEPEPTIFDYRPGANYDGSRWMSHNRHGGAAHIYGGANWIEMRTHYNGAEYVRQSEDPPFIYTGTWQNMLNVGEDRWPDGNPYLRN